MHIVFLTPEYPDLRRPEGGLGTYVRKTGLELARRGCRVTVFVLAPRAYSENDGGINLRFVRRAKFHWRLHRVKALHPWLDLAEQWINARRMKKAVLASNKMERIDIFQTPNFKTLGLFLCHNRFFPVVCRCSSYQPLWRSANGARRSLPEAVGDWLEARQLVEADAAFSPSQFIARAYERFEAVKPAVIRTPLDLTPVPHDPSVYAAHLEGKKYLLYFGALNGVKGVDLLIEALPAILSARADLSIVFIGRNDPLPGGVKAVEALQSRCRAEWEAGRVIYFPSMPKAQLYPLIEHAFGVVLPSRVDNYPNACLEALALGVPVIGTHDSSLDEMIEDGRTGFLAKNSDSESLRNVIYRLCEMNESDLEIMKNNIRNLTNAMKDEDRVSQLLVYYASVIRQHKSDTAQ